LRLENDGRVDPLVRTIERLAEAVLDDHSGVRSALRGDWLGHALHPLMTDLPLGCWLGAGLLDLFGGRAARPAARRLVGLGLLAVPLTAATGLNDWSELRDSRPKRVGVVHAVGNGMVAAAYFVSWRARRAERFGIGILAGMTGGVLAWGTGYLGGHLSFARGAGVEPRGRVAELPVMEPAH
jgi:uncharacterized membrane protein